MDPRASRFPRREFLVAVAGFGSTLALGWVTLPGLPSLLRQANVELPSWAATTAASAGAYRVAVLRPQLLEALPCFCGCATYQPAHHSLRDCFLKPDGSFESHAAGCTTCQEEALAASRWADQGLVTTDVRSRLVAAFSERGPSTDGAV
jgi:Protein of unknown function with PCYCGC motif